MRKGGGKGGKPKLTMALRGGKALPVCTHRQPQEECGKLIGGLGTPDKDLLLSSRAV